MKWTKRAGSTVLGTLLGGTLAFAVTGPAEAGERNGKQERALIEIGGYGNIVKEVCGLVAGDRINGIIQWTTGSLGGGKGGGGLLDGLPVIGGGGIPVIGGGGIPVIGGGGDGGGGLLGGGGKGGGGLLGGGKGGKGGKGGGKGGGGLLEGLPVIGGGGIPVIGGGGIPVIGGGGGGGGDGGGGLLGGGGKGGGGLLGGGGGGGGGLLGGGGGGGDALGGLFGVFDTDGDGAGDREARIDDRKVGASRGGIGYVKVNSNWKLTGTYFEAKTANGEQLGCQTRVTGKMKKPPAHRLPSGKQTPDSPGLPVTGVPVAGIALGGGGLTGLGVLLMGLGRRRRPSFAADTSASTTAAGTLTGAGAR